MFIVCYYNRWGIALRVLSYGTVPTLATHCDHKVGGLESVSERLCGLAERLLLLLQLMRTVQLERMNWCNKHERRKHQTWLSPERWLAETISTFRSSVRYDTWLSLWYLDLLDLLFLGSDFFLSCLGQGDAVEKYNSRKLGNSFRILPLCTLAMRPRVIVLRWSLSPRPQLLLLVHGTRQAIPQYHWLCRGNLKSTLF